MTRADLIREQQMTKRAKVYLLIATARHLAVGLACVLAPSSFKSGSYQGIIDALAGIPFLTSIELWGWAFLGTSLACFIGAVIGRETPARVGLVFSVVTTACWAVGFAASMFMGSSAGSTGFFIWAAVAAKDATMLRQPLRNPFEPLVQKLVADKARRDKQ